MAENNSVVKLLNDLVEINHNRVKGYELAASELDSADADLQAIFRSMANDSKQYAAALKEVVVFSGGQASADSTNQGKVYRAWMHVKSTYSGHDRYGILDSCDHNEAEAQEAYLLALESPATIGSSIRSLIKEQQTSLQTAHDLIKNFKGAAQAAVA
ncbi:MAG: PA2169 family four-helix-bundle protein [Ferruginibacter sp.]|nr:PA2169 family four-helix-bundle protein [Ferruginibacter sp.]